MAGGRVASLSLASLNARGRRHTSLLATTRLGSTMAAEEGQKKLKHTKIVGKVSPLLVHYLCLIKLLPEPPVWPDTLGRPGMRLCEGVCLGW